MSLNSQLLLSFDSLVQSISSLTYFKLIVFGDFCLLPDSVMGRGTDVGIIPRFCEDLFKRIDKNDDSSVSIYVHQLSCFPSL